MVETGAKSQRTVTLPFPQETKVPSVQLVTQPSAIRPWGSVLNPGPSRLAEASIFWTWLIHRRHRRVYPGSSGAHRAMALWWSMLCPWPSVPRTA